MDTDWKNTMEVAGIMDTEAVLANDDFHKTYKRLGIKGDANILRTKLAKIVADNLQRDGFYWYWEIISQAEYETYRDLHEFRVMKRYD
jgi:hypothetical protein